MIYGLSAWFHEAPLLIYVGDSLLTAAHIDGVDALLLSVVGSNL